MYTFTVNWEHLTQVTDIIVKGRVSLSFASWYPWIYIYTAIDYKKNYESSFWSNYIPEISNITFKNLSQNYHHQKVREIPDWGCTTTVLKFKCLQILHHMSKRHQRYPNFSPPNKGTSGYISMYSHLANHQLLVFA